MATLREVAAAKLQAAQMNKWKVGNIECPWLHDFICDGCRVNPIHGYLFYCQIRRDFGLCRSCFRKEAPELKQQYVRIERNFTSQPFQIRCMECHDCGLTPIQGPRYQHKTQASYDLCEECFTSATTSKDPRASNKAQVQDFEKILETKIRLTRSPKRKQDLAFHFDKRCDECFASPIRGPCYTSIQNSDYDLCAYCHDEKLLQGTIKNKDFVVIEWPKSSSVYHLKILCCANCGALPICGPAYQHNRKVNKAVCLLCFLNIKEEKKCHYTRVQPPRSLYDQTNKPSNIYLMHREQAPPHVSGSNSAPLSRDTTTPSQELKERSASFGNSTEPLYIPRNIQQHTSQGSGQGPGPTPSTFHHMPPPGRTGSSTRSVPRSPHYSSPVNGRYSCPSPNPSQHPGNTYNSTGQAAAAPQYDSATVAAMQHYHKMYDYYLQQSTQRQQEILAQFHKQSHQSNELQNQFVQQFLQNLGNIVGGGGGGGGVPDYSSFMGGGGGGIPDYSSFMGGGGGGIPDYSSLMGGGGGGIPDYSSLMGGGGGGGIPDYSSLMGGGGSIPDYSSLMGGGGGGMPDYSSLLGAAGGVDPSSIMNGAGGGVINALLGSMTGLGFN